MYQGKMASCLVTYETAAAAYAAVDEIDGMEAPELADVPLKSEIAAIGGPRLMQTRQAPIRAWCMCI